jgi:flavin-dependent dehydrogenase
MPVLERLGLLPQLSAGPYQLVRGARLIAPDETEWHLRFADYDLGLPPFGLVIPRFELDQQLCRHAAQQGANFMPGFLIKGPLYEGKTLVGVQGARNGQTVHVRAPLTVLATGTSIGLLRAFGLLSRMPPGINAIRGYFAGIPDLTEELEFYFDNMLAPGFAWAFPVGKGLANVGLGVFAHSGTKIEIPSLRRLLGEFMESRPRLRGAREAGPLKGYPLRIDFPSISPTGPGFMVVGEALGLVNPVTGEGIDLAMESAELAAGIADVALRKGDTSLRQLKPYDRALDDRYASFFRGARLLLHLATSPTAINILVRQALRRPYLARLIAGINLGVASPWLAFTPRVWWDILT